MVVGLSIWSNLVPVDQRRRMREHPWNTSRFSRNPDSYSALQRVLDHSKLPLHLQDCILRRSIGLRLTHRAMLDHRLSVGLPRVPHGLQQRLDAAGKMILIDGDYNDDDCDVFFNLKMGHTPPPSRTDFLNSKDCSCRQNAV